MLNRFRIPAAGLLILFLAAGCSSPALIELNPGWLISISDSNAYRDPGFDDSGWDPITLPSLVSKDTPRRTVWLRKRVIIPASYRDRDLALHLGAIWDVDVTWFNGEKIGQTGSEYPDFFSSWNVNRYYFIPGSLIRYGEENVIAVKVFANQNLILNDVPFIGPLQRIRSYNFWQNYKSQYLALAGGFLTLFLALSSLIQFLLDRRDRLSFRYFFISFLWTILSLHFYAPDFGISYNTHDKLYYLLVSVEIVLIYFLIGLILRKRSRPLDITVLVLGAVGILICATATDTDPITGWRFQAVGALGLLSQAIWGVAIARGLRQQEGKIIFGSYLVFMVCLGHDVLAINYVLSYDFFWINVGYPVMIVAFGVILSLRAIRTARKLAESTGEIGRKNENLQGILRQLRESAGALNTFAEDLKDSSNRMRDLMSAQSASLEETAAAIEEVATSAETITETARSQHAGIDANRALVMSYATSLAEITAAAGQAKNLSATSQEQTAQSRGTLTEIVDGMNRMQDSSGSIREIANIINDIAEQTNLLSLNASIEAARAGEHGRGFSVVAQEIGKLADRSIEQARTIQAIIKGSVEDIELERTIVLKAATALQSVEASVDDVNRAVGSILERCVAQDRMTADIERNLTEISRKGGEISVATQEQQTTFTEITRSTNDLMEMTTGVVDHVELLMNAFHELKKQIETFKDMAEKEY